MAGSPAVVEILAKANGEYVDFAEYKPDGGRGGTITVTMKSDHDGVLTSTFNYNTGDASFSWSP
ncbi:MAG: hypothetical protein ACYTDT_10095 [Planctomycetota bacterium]|jgi:hypothetical protein